MISPMNQIVFFLHPKEKNVFLRKLQNLGLVDLESADLTTNKIRNLIERKKNLKEIYREIQKFKKNALNPKPVNLPPAAHLLLDYLEKQWQGYQKFQLALVELEEEKKEIALWQNTDPDKYYALAKNGLYLHLYSGSYRFFRKYDFAQYPMKVLFREKDKVFFVIFTDQKEAPKIPFLLHPFPARSLAEVEQEIDFIMKQIEEKEAIFSYLSQKREIFKIALCNLENQIQREKARLVFKGTLNDRLYLTKGYYPQEKEKEIINFCQKNQIPYATFPAKESEKVPILLKNNRVVKLFEDITQIFSLPSYKELDPTPFFAPFFTLFFGLCFADTGYGLLLLILSLFLLLKKPLRKWGEIGLVLSSAAIVSGIFLNSFFGENLFNFGKQNGLLEKGGDFALFAAYNLDGKTVYPAMSLSLFLGVIQIFLALLLQSINLKKQGHLMAFLKPVGMALVLISIFSLAAHNNFLNLGINEKLFIGPLAVGKWLTFLPEKLALLIFFSGIFIILFTNNPQSKWWKRPILGLWALYQFFTGLLGDFLSYIRLFALGLAGGLLGNAFNQIAFMLMPKIQNVWDFLNPLLWISLIVFVFGHGLNFALSLLGAFVHPLRLTFVEFYKNLGFRGGGRPFSPFRKIQIENI